MKNSMFEMFKEKEESLTKEISEARSTKTQLEIERDLKINSTVVKYFGGVETDLPNFRFEDSSANYIEFSCDGESVTREKYDKDQDEYIEKTFFIKERLGTIELKQKYGSFSDSVSQNKYEYSAVGLSSHSSSDHLSDLQLGRYQILGQVAMVIQDFRDDILAEINQIYNEYTELIATPFELMHDLDRSLDIVKKDRKEHKQQSLIKDLKKGLTINSDTKAEVQVRFDWFVKSIIKAKITRTSYSGKSVDLDVTCVHNIWDDKLLTFVPGTLDQQLKNVRVEKLFESFITYPDITWTVE